MFRLLGLDGVVFKSVFRVWVEGEDFVSGMFLKWHLKSGFIGVRGVSNLG